MHKKILVTGKTGEISKAIASWLSEKPNTEVVNISVRGNEWKEISFKDYDVVVHVAGIVPKDGVEAEDYYKINTELTKELAQKAKADGVGQFVYLSSMAVYGTTQSFSNKKGCVSIFTNCNPTSDYGKSKLLAEEALNSLKDELFLVSIIRVPSIYAPNKTEYIDQYKHLTEKFSKIPVAFKKKYKSMIYLDNLCELIYLMIKNAYCGVCCPDDGKISAYEICCEIMPSKKKSKLLGLLFETALRFSGRIKDYYGSIYYDENLANVFNGEYRVVNLKEAIKRIYEN